MNTQELKKININIDENQLLLILLALSNSKNEWNYRSDKEELYKNLFNQYVDLVQVVA